MEKRKLCLMLLQLLTLYAQRSIVEKHSRYALYHPPAEALASILTDMPCKILNVLIFNLTLYFVTNLRQNPGALLFFTLILFFLTLAMSMILRAIISISRALSDATVPTGVLVLGLVVYAGFAIPPGDMLGWARWINYLDPLAYSFESLLINEFYGGRYACLSYVPTGSGYDSGVSGAGKAILLDVLAARTTTGVISGEILLTVASVILYFNTKLDIFSNRIFICQLPQFENLDYIEEIIKLLEMEEFANTVIGMSGEGLDLEQRKRLTIGKFDRLLVLAEGGKTVYFGDIGQNYSILTSYFERNGGFPCPHEANPADWVKEIIGAAPGSHSDLDWHQVWLKNAEHGEVLNQLVRIKEDKLHEVDQGQSLKDGTSYQEFAAPFKQKAADCKGCLAWHIIRVF
ncbi:MAG: hypothetical protein M1834_000986 [Cirrosporium novae-zelandiae]|nr:MAG: hypothetical protein M1834_000986 [Cirrosporium novae-zelandiae]